jgi:flagellar biosynthesis/type III secretory pathway M-ring protein FliF/YscJ
VRRRGSIPKIRLVIALAAVLVVAIVLTMSVKRYQAPQAAPPEALAHIAQKNREAALIAAARQRADSAASTNAAEDLAEARRSGSAEANAMLTRFADGDNQTVAAGRTE